jgi:hypothetical protein
VVVELELFVEGLAAGAAEEVLDAGVDATQVTVEVTLLEKGGLAGGARVAANLRSWVRCSFAFS